MPQARRHINNLRLRNTSFGNERRVNMTKSVLRRGTPLPKPVVHADIDQAVDEWLNNLGITYEGRRLPVYKLYSNQRINEYKQIWSSKDENGNPVMDFMTITRENDPKFGKQQNGMFNIPGDRFYEIFTIPVMGENGVENYQRYEMRQPFCVDFIYSVNIIGLKMELVNSVNEIMHNEFKSCQRYIEPNGYYMSMALTDVSDSSENGLEDRRYFSQTYKINVKGYIIRPEDFRVTDIASRVKIGLLVDDKPDRRKSKVSVEEWENECNRPDDGERYHGKVININMEFDSCERMSAFVSDFNFQLDEVTTDNVYDMVVFVNGEPINPEDGLYIYDGDKVEVEISQDDETAISSIVFSGHDPYEVVDGWKTSEIVSDGEVGEENTNVKKKETDG